MLQDFTALAGMGGEGEEGESRALTGRTLRGGCLAGQSRGCWPVSVGLEMPLGSSLGVHCPHIYGPSGSTSPAAPCLSLLTNCCLPSCTVTLGRAMKTHKKVSMDVNKDILVNPVDVCAGLGAGVASSSVWFSPWLNHLPTSTVLGSC